MSDMPPEVTVIVEPPLPEINVIVEPPLPDVIVETVDEIALSAHVNDPNPHPVFFNTEGVSLVARYRNAKV